MSSTTETASKTAAELLAKKMEELIDKAADQMDDEQFKNAEKRSSEVTDRARVRSSRHDRA